MWRLERNFHSHKPKYDRNDQKWKHHSSTKEQDTKWKVENVVFNTESQNSWWSDQASHTKIKQPNNDKTSSILNSACYIFAAKRARVTEMFALSDNMHPSCSKWWGLPICFDWISHHLMLPLLGSKHFNHPQHWFDFYLLGGQTNVASGCLVIWSLALLFWNNRS